MTGRIITALFLFIVFVNTSCENDGIDPDEELISVFGATESHNTGIACASCHVSGGSGEGWFNLSGSVYDGTLTNPYPNATVRLYTEAQGAGSLVYTLEVDGLGNFYTTDNIDYGNGLYVLVEGSQSTEYMHSTITDGDCNSCHGVSVDRIWVQ